MRARTPGALAVGILLCPPARRGAGSIHSSRRGRNQDHRRRARRCLRATARPPKSRPAPRAFAAASSPPIPALLCGARRCESRRRSCASIEASAQTPRDAMSSPSFRRAATTSSSREADTSRCSSDSGGRSSSGRPLDVGNAQIVERIDFALPRGGVIAGRVTDELGEPLAGVRMQAMRYQYLPNGQRQLTPVATAALSASQRTTSENFGCTA